jgi:hypothetical protein
MICVQNQMAEEYPDISLHDDFFHINRLLYKAYNGKFPHIKLSVITCTISGADTVTKEILLKALSVGLSDRNVINRLYDDELTGKKPFTDADDIIWSLESISEVQYKLVTSDYWISEEDFNYMEFEAEIKMYQEH